MRRQDFLNNFWGYYLMLEKKLMTTFNYVELSTSNFSTFSNEYALLIQSIGAELDSFFKLYCSFDFNERKNISHYANVILDNEPDIVNIELNILSKQLSIKPFESWSLNHRKRKKLRRTL